MSDYINYLNQSIRFVSDPSLLSPIGLFLTLVTSILSIFQFYRNYNLQNKLNILEAKKKEEEIESIRVNNDRIKEEVEKLDIANNEAVEDVVPWYTRMLTNKAVVAELEQRIVKANNELIINMRNIGYMNADINSIIQQISKNNYNQYLEVDIAKAELELSEANVSLDEVKYTVSNSKNNAETITKVNEAISRVNDSKTKVTIAKIVQTEITKLINEGDAYVCNIENIVNTNTNILDNVVPTITLNATTPVVPNARTLASSNDSTPVATNANTPVVTNDSTPVATNANTPVVTNDSTPVATNANTPVVTNANTPVATNANTDDALNANKKELFSKIETAINKGIKAYRHRQYQYKIILKNMQDKQLEYAQNIIGLPIFISDDIENQ
jgi:hypothetical protein